jgi:rRNA-processing protein FCF1
MGIKVIIPKQVQGELRGVDKSGVAFKIIDQNEFIEIDLKNKNVDQGIIDYGKKNMDVFIATLDRGIKKKIENSVVIIREKSRLEIR